MSPVLAEDQVQILLLDTNNVLQGESNLEDAKQDFTSLSYVTRVNGWGSFAGAVIWAEADLAEFCQPNWRIVVRRKPDGKDWYIDFVGFIRRVEWATPESDITIVQIWGREIDSLLGNYCIEPLAGNEYSIQTGRADDVVKGYVRSECIDDATKVWPNLIVAGNSTESLTTLTRRARYNRLSDFIRDIRAAADDFDYKVTISADYSTFTLDTYYPQYGLDRRIGTASPLIFSLANQNMGNPRYWKRGYDALSEVVVLGQDTGIARTIQIVTNAATEAEWGFMQRAYDAREEEAANLTSVGEGVLELEGPTEGIAFNILPTESCRYGVDWKVGYRVSAKYVGVEADLHIEQVRCVVSAGKSEEVTPTMRLLEIRS